MTVKVISPVVSPAIAKPALTDNKSFTVTVVNVPAAGVSLPITFPSISPALIYAVNGAASVPNWPATSVPTLVILVCAAVANVPVIEVLAVNVVNEPAAGVAPPTIVPSIAPASISTLVMSTSPVPCWCQSKVTV